MQTSLGPAIGRAYVPGYGEGVVFDTGHPGYFTVQVTKSGIRHHVRREMIQWRSTQKKEVA